MPDTIKEMLRIMSEAVKKKPEQKVIDSTNLPYVYQKLKEKFLMLTGGTVQGNLAVKGTVTADRLTVSSELHIPGGSLYLK